VPIILETAMVRKWCVSPTHRYFCTTQNFTYSFHLNPYPVNQNASFKELNPWTKTISLKLKIARVIHTAAEKKYRDRWILI
jgi:hypothetical protein